MRVKSVIVMLCTAFAMQIANAAEPRSGVTHKAILDLKGATQLVQAAQAYASQHGWPCAVAVVDDGGWPILTARMDSAPVVAGIDLAQGKARTSALFKRSSDDLEKGINGGRTAMITAGLLMMKGGQPIRVEGQVVGAIGVSADTPAHDDEIALAALQSLQAPQTQQ
jgi:glc operon protein GlcG